MQMKNISLQIFKKYRVPNSPTSCWEFKNYRANNADLDEVAHNEPPHQDLRCLPSQLFSSLVHKEL